MSNKPPKGIKPKEPLWAPTHRYKGGDRLVFFFVNEEVVRIGDGYSEGVSVYQNEAGSVQHIHDTDMEEI